MLCEVLDFNLVEVAQTTVQGDECGVDTLDFEHLHHLAGEVQACGRCGDSTLFPCENGLEIVHILLPIRTVLNGDRLCSVRIIRRRCRNRLLMSMVNNIVWQRRLTKSVELALEFVVRTIVEEPQRTSAARGIVDDLGHHRARIVEEELVANSNLSCRFNENVPQPHLGIKLSEEEDLDFSICLLLCSVQTGRENLCVVEDHHIAIVEVFAYILEFDVIVLCRLTLDFLVVEVDSLRLAVNDHHAGLIAPRDLERLCGPVTALDSSFGYVRIECNSIIRQIKIEL